MGESGLIMSSSSCSSGAPRGSSGDRVATEVISTRSRFALARRFRVSRGVAVRVGVAVSRGVRVSRFAVMSTRSRADCGDHRRGSSC